MASDQMTLVRYIRERTEELQKLSRDAHLDVLVHLFGVAALEATKHEGRMLPPVVPHFKQIRPRTNVNDHEAAQRRLALQRMLEGLIDVAVRRSGGTAQAAIFVADNEGKSLHRIAGMTPAYGAYADGIEIGEHSAACGLAAALRRPVITDDITKDPTWTDWKWLAEEFNYRSCWSFPIEGPDGKIIGTFSMYFEKPSQASERDIQFATIVTDAAAEIIGRHGAN